MEYKTISELMTWAELHGWFEVMTSVPAEEDELINHYFLTPAGAMIQVIEGEGEVISLIYPNIRESN